MSRKVEGIPDRCPQARFGTRAVACLSSAPLPHSLCQQRRRLLVLRAARAVLTVGSVGLASQEGCGIRVLTPMISWSPAAGTILNTFLALARSKSIAIRYST